LSVAEVIQRFLRFFETQRESALKHAGSKGKNRNKQCWPVPKTNRLKMELLKLQLRLKHNNPDALVFEEAKVSLRKPWLAAYAEAGVLNGVRMFYSVRHAYVTDMANKGMECRSLLVSWATAT
jgi:hypothetical protein